MARHTQAHIPKRVDKRRPGGLSAMVKRQTEYYMGAKLLEIGVDPKSALYRWTVSEDDRYVTYTYSAYWGDSREELERSEANG